MLRYLLDTNLCICVIKQRPLTAPERFNRHAGHMAMSSITLAELFHGPEKSAQVHRNLAVVEDFASRLEMLPDGAKAAQHCTSVRAALERAGAPIGVNDLHISAQARSEGSTVVTNNRRESDRVPGLLLEDWAP